MQKEITMSIYDKALKKLDEIAEDEAMTDGWEAYSIFWDWLESEAAEQSVHRTALPVRVLNAICYGTTLATFLWLLFGSR